jgi:Histidine kinase-, DNA gyrase B-, and HSP90-like ATPase
MDKIDTVSIKIQTGVYGQFRNLNNKVWFALGEYVDNAVQSFENNKERLRKANNGKYQFTVKITVNRLGNYIRIYDNAAGIDVKNFPRAFEPANIPIDNTGLHEFGMGMKTASIWLSDIWNIKTAALDEDVERFVEFDLHKVLAEEREELKVKNTPKSKSVHFTELNLHNLSANAPSLQQMDKIKKHLASIYRKFICSGELQLYVNEELLSYAMPEILTAPYYETPNEKPIVWKKMIKFSLGQYKVSGFIAILNTMSTNELNGFSLFRRGRVIEGSHNEKYRPKALCGQVGSPRYKRIFGELELDGFTVSFDKGSFREQEDLESLMDALKQEISAKGFDLYGQAEKYIKSKPIENSIKIAKNIATVLKQANQQVPLNTKVDNSLKAIDNKATATENKAIIVKAKPIESHEDFITIKDEKYKLKLVIIHEPKSTELYSFQIDADEFFAKTVTYTVNLAHTFFTRFEKLKNEADYQPIIAIIRSLVLAELVAPSQGTKNAGNIRINFNQFLRNV